ncbi:MAG: ribonuclease P protein component 1 [Candidatus Bathyarchaeota archaeon]|nr:MAG: ribonuclease P protein component 1 [Candidatus Bathyarchaeota archaeon]
MKLTPTILKNEFIGLNAKVVNSSNPNVVGIEGKVINETRNTFVITHGNKNKTIAKNTTVFHFTMSNGTTVEINGKTIVGRPEDRIKKKLRRRW